MAGDYRDYEPMLLDAVSIETLKSDAYRRFILAAAVEPGVRLILARRRGRPTFPFVDTKFNPNTGADLDESAYDAVYAWFLGRGSEALAGHLAVLDSLDGLSDSERAEAREVFSTLVENMTAAVAELGDKFGGRMPFRVDLRLEPLDAAGAAATVDASVTGAADVFCGKGLIATGEPARVRVGVRMLERSADLVRADRCVEDQFGRVPPGVGQGMRMLHLGSARLAGRHVADAALRAVVFDVAADFLAFVLDRHYDAATGVFSEYLDRATGAGGELLDPGHCIEFVGLGLGAIEAVEADAAAMNDARRALFARARALMPGMLLRAWRLGYNAERGGLAKSVNNRSGVPIDADMPWWNLPETMRAAARAAAVADDPGTRDQCLEALRLAHNAYFANFLNRDKMLFPFQTRSGATGQVVDKVPAVPEGDPLYHANLSLLEMLEVIEKL